MAIWDWVYVGNGGNHEWRWMSRRQVRDMEQARQRQLQQRLEPPELLPRDARPPPPTFPPPHEVPPPQEVRPPVLALVVPPPAPPTARQVITLPVRPPQVALALELQVVQAVRRVAMGRAVREVAMARACAETHRIVLGLCACLSTLVIVVTAASLFKH